MTSTITGPTTGPGPAAAVPPPADLDRRFYAYVVDRAIGWGLGAGVGALVWFGLDQRGPLLVAGSVLGAVALVTVVLAVLQGTSGATPGKSALGLRAVDPETGRPPGIRRALLRALVLGGAGLPTAGIGVATLAWTAATDPGNRRRGWHDQVTGSVVVDVRHRGSEMGETPAEAPRGLVNLTAMRLVQAPEVPAPTVAPTPVATTPVAAAPVDPSPAPTARWRVTFDTGETFVVEGLALVGRGPEPRAGEAVRHVVPLRSSDMSLSKTHAQFHIARDGVLVVMDRGSTNGSVLLRRGMSRELGVGKPASLLDGDRVKFGDREMHVVRES